MKNGLEKAIRGAERLIRSHEVQEAGTMGLTNTMVVKVETVKHKHLNTGTLFYPVLRTASGI